MICTVPRSLNRTTLCGLRVECPPQTLMHKHLMPRGGAVLESCISFRRQGLIGGTLSLGVDLQDPFPVHSLLPDCRVLLPGPSGPSPCLCLPCHDLLHRLYRINPSFLPSFLKMLLVGVLVTVRRKETNIQRNPGIPFQVFIPRGTESKESVANCICNNIHSGA